MQTIVKYAVYSASGCLVNMSHSREEMEQALQFWPGGWLEELTYPLRDGLTHGQPKRRKITQEG